MLSLLPYCILSALFLGLAAMLVRISPFYRRITEHPPRYAAIEGLRGFLALGVFFHHALIGYYAQKTGIWEDPPITFFTLTGHVGVSIFFMVTGFLFWEKALRQEGRLNLKELYTSRLLRLAPAYLLSVLLVIVAIALPVGPHDLDELIPKDVRYVLLFKGLRSVNDLNGVYWTLVWEWRFYLLLPLAGLCLRWKWGDLVPAAAIIIYTVWRPETMYIINFVAGGVAAWLRLRYPDWNFKNPIHTFATLACLVIVFTCFERGFGYLQSLLMFAFFLSVVYGNSLFGLLQTRPARAIGAASYSLYLMHCIVLYVLINTFNLWQPVAGLDLISYWLLVAGMGSVALTVAWLSYRYVEYPFFHRRKRFVPSS